MYLTTSHLLLRPIEYTDVDQLVALWADPEVTRYMGGPRNPDEVRDALDEEIEQGPSESDDLFPLIEKSTGAVVGHCGLLQKDVDGAQETELVYVLVKRVWGRGYAAEIGEALLEFAFRVLELPRVISLIDPENEPSKRVARKLGMYFERLVPRPDDAERELWVIERPEA